MPIIKHNKLIETSYKLNSREQFFVLYLISQISQADTGFQDYTMHYSEIERIINFDGKRRIANKSEVFSLMDKLNSVPILYEKGNIVGKSVWLQHVEHNKGTDEFTFSLSERLRDYLLQLKEHFTRYSISNIVYLNANAIRLYEVLKRYQFLGECEITVDKLKFFLGIEDSYPKWYEFKRWVLVPSQQQIEKYTDIKFTFIPAKKERKKILSLKFTIIENDPQHATEQLTLLSKVDKDLANKPVVQRLEIRSREAEVLSRAQLLAFQFLAGKGVNQSFIINYVLNHTRLQAEPVQGYEDLYIKGLWNFFISKTTATKAAGAFVNWWKNGKLTSDALHARIVEAVVNRKKMMTDKERDRRKQASTMTAKAFREWVAQDDLPQKDVKIPVMPQKLKSRIFDIAEFQQAYPHQHHEIYQQVLAKYQEAHNNLNMHFDINKYQKAIDDKVNHQCEQWYRAKYM